MNLSTKTAKELKMSAIMKFESYFVIGYNKNRTTTKLAYAANPKALVKAWKKRVEFNAKQFAMCGIDVLASYTVILSCNQYNDETFVITLD